VLKHQSSTGHPALLQEPSSGDGHSAVPPGFASIQHSQEDQACEFEASHAWSGFSAQVLKHQDRRQSLSAGPRPSGLSYVNRLSTLRVQKQIAIGSARLEIEHLTDRARDSVK